VRVAEYCCESTHTTYLLPHRGSILKPDGLAVHRMSESACTRLDQVAGARERRSSMHGQVIDLPLT
jgi:hypothetical protein